MFKSTNRQSSLFGAASNVSPAARTRLQEGWPGVFQRKVLPLLLAAESEFAGLYAEDGRPNWSVAHTLGILLLQDWFDLDDQAALDQLTFDVRWQFALDLHPNEAYLSRRSLVQFRQRIYVGDRDLRAIRQLFDTIVTAAAADLGVSFARQRLDSTLVTSNIAKRGRTALLASTLRHFLRQVDVADQTRLSVGLAAWFVAAEEAVTADSQQIGRWLYEVKATFAEHPLAVSEAYQLVLRVLTEHFEIVPAAESPSGGEGGGSDPSLRLREKPQGGGATLQSPFDPDAGFGHKGAGYHVHVAETCGNGDVAELITDVHVVPACVNDAEQSTPALDRLAASGRLPNELTTDKGFASGGSLVEAQDRGVEMVAPVSKSRLPEGSIGRDQFEWKDDRIVRCPSGHEPLRHDLRTTAKNQPPTLHAYFDGRTCSTCPLLGRCVVRGPNNRKTGHYHVEATRELRARDQRLTEQKTPEFKKRYAIRAGIEGTNSELKAQHGLGRLRVRGRRAVRLSVTMKTMACNVKRWMNREKTRTGRAPSRLVA
jgi:hypothetical protein